MLDTVVLLLNKNMFLVTQPDRFEPSAKLVLNTNSPMGGRGYIYSKQNPTKNELKMGNYKPRLTLTNRFNHTGNRELTMKIELSIPKLLYGNNFDELTNDDFGQSIELLHKKLAGMGVSTSLDCLSNAPVSAIHYSKNIPLKEGITPRYLINKIKQSNNKLFLDTNQSDYRNEGYSFKLHTNSYEVMFYDKIKDIKNAKLSEKRAIEKENTIQLNLFDKPHISKYFEVIRMEVRLNKRQKIKQLFRLLNIDSELTYKNLYSETISKNILIHYLDEIERNRLPLLDTEKKSVVNFLSDLVITNPGLSLKKIIRLFGIRQIFAEVPMRELRVILNKYGDRNWYRLISEAKNIKIPSAINPISTLRTNIINYHPLKLINFCI